MRGLQPPALRWPQVLSIYPKLSWWDKMQLGLKRSKTILEYLKKCIISSSGELLSASLLVRKGGWLPVLWTKLCPSKFVLYRSSQHTVYHGGWSWTCPPGPLQGKAVNSCPVQQDVGYKHTEDLAHRSEKGLGVQQQGGRQETLAAVNDTFPWGYGYTQLFCYFCK